MEAPKHTGEKIKFVEDNSSDDRERERDLGEELRKCVSPSFGIKKGSEGNNSDLQLP